jgi:glucose/arabinose dehydrogenase
MLYFALGDGGSGGDPLNHGQNIDTLFGSILRLDVRRAPPYRIPRDNPFVGRAGRDEIYAYGLRNPWRFSFDRASGELWAADVGQNAIEEINIIRPGGNYGWRAKEGGACYDRALCNRPGFIDPVHEYRHGPHCSVTGGYVYRGAELGALVGAYIFGDFCSGYIWARDPNGSVRELARSGLKLTAFGEDLAGELYALDYAGGVYRLRPPGI